LVCLRLRWSLCLHVRLRLLLLPQQSSRRWWFLHLAAVSDEMMVPTPCSSKYSKNN
jgi:hypothetical protein